MNSTNTKKSSAGRKKAFLSIFLMVALLLTGAFAFLTSTDSKTNVFTVGKVDIELIEKFDTDLSGEIEDDETYDASNTVVAIEGGKEIMPGQKIIKQPSIKNTGKNSAYVYMAVGLPVADLEDVYTATDAGNINISGKKVDIKLRAYAIQENYKQADNANEAWERYFEASSLGTEADQSDSAFQNRVQLFKTYPSSGTDSGTNNEWQRMDTYYTAFEAADEGSGFADLAYNWYIYKYDEMLEPDETTESALFDTVALVGEIGEAMPVSVSYYAPQSVVSKANEVSTMALEVVSNIPEDFVLVNQEYYTPGDALILYTDDSLAQTGYRYDWVLADDVKTCAYTGMTVEEDTQLLTTYQDLVNTSGDSANDDAAVPTTQYNGSDYLGYSIEKDSNGQYYATVIGADSSHENYPNTLSTVVIPVSVTVTGESNGTPLLDNGVVMHCEYNNIESGKSIPVKKIQLAQWQWDSSTYTSPAPEAIALGSIADTMTVPDSVTSLGFCGSIYEHNITSGFPLREVNVPASCELSWGAFYDLVNLEKVDFTNTLTRIPSEAFYNCKNLKTIDIPESVTSVEDKAFDKCSKLTNVAIPNNTTDIGVYAFRDCSALTSITLPASIRTIKDEAFLYDHVSNINYLGTIDDWCRISFGTIWSNPAYGGRGDLCIDGTSVSNVIISSDVTELKYTFSGCENLLSATIPKGVLNIYGAFANCTSLTSVTIPNGVTSIGELAFFGCTGLTSVTIPNSVTSIGTYAFNYCTSLTSITIPDSVKNLDRSAFGYCHSLSTVTIGSGLETLSLDGASSAGVFEGCDALENINISTDNSFYSSKDGIVYTKDFLRLVIYPEGNKTENLVLPEGLQEISDNAFRSNQYIISISIPSTVTSIGSDIINKNVIETITISTENTVYDSRNNCNAIIETETNTLISGCKNTVIPDNVTSIGSSAFVGCGSLTSITISNSVTSIGQSAFSGCTGLTSVTISNSVTSIGQSAFSGCTGLTSVTIPDSVTSIGSCAFYYCDSLLDLQIGSGVKSIGTQSFEGCSNIEKIIIDPKNSVYDSRNNCNAIIETATNTLIRGCKNTVIPDDVTSIGEAAFGGCDVERIVLPNGVTAIGDYAFRFCDNLTTIVLPKSITRIGYGAYWSLTIPENLIKHYLSVTYQGTLAEWSKVDCPSGSLPSGITIYCTDGTTTTQ